MAYVPALQAAGLYRLKAPFDTLLAPNIRYTCDGIRTLQSLSADGEDAFELVYAPVALSRAEMLADIEADAVIVTLKASDAQRVNVPSTYILGMPDSTGIPYLGFYMALDLGTLPEGINLDYVSERVVGVVRETIGVITKVDLIATTNPMRLTQDQHKVVEATRELRITETESDYAKFLRVQKENQQLRDKVRLMEKWITDHKPK